MSKPVLFGYKNINSPDVYLYYFQSFTQSVYHMYDYVNILGNTHDHSLVESLMRRSMPLSCQQAKYKTRASS